MNSSLLFSGLLSALVCVSTASAQWSTVTYELKPGWSSLYLGGDASWQTPDQHFAGEDDIEEVWRWNPNPQPVQFSTTPAEPSSGTPEWSVWRRGQPQASDLTLLSGQTAYLVRLRTGAPARTFSLKQRVEPPRVQWLRTGGNLLGFPARKTGAGLPVFSSYFGLFPAALGSKIFRYNGGLLDANNPIRVLSPAVERLDPTQAYWFETRTVSDFAGPLHFEISDATGLNFGNNGALITVTVRNRTAATQTLTFSPESSEAPPAGQPAISGPVALTRRVFDGATGQYNYLPVTAPFTLALLPNAAVPVAFGVDRAAMGGQPGSFFAGILRIRDAANMMDVPLPVTAGASSMAGLWAGDAELTDVESKVPGFTGTKTGRSFPLRWIIHVDDSGRTTLLSQAILGVLKGADDTPGVATRESALKPDKLGSAIRLTAAHLPLDRVIPATGGFGVGGSCTGTIGLAYNDPVNPFVHQYHPDHDNKDARFNASPAGVESWNVSRAVTFSFPAAPPAGASGSWGSKVLTGTCSETFTGLRKDAVTATGTVIFRRISDIGTLTAP